MSKQGASLLNQHIIIEAKATVFNVDLDRDEPKTDQKTGNPVYEKFYEGFAEYTPTLGGESFNNEVGKTFVKARATFRIWDSPEAREIKETMRVNFRGYAYEILSAEPTKDLRYIDLLTEKRL